jgi:hypothetical protein
MHLPKFGCWFRWIEVPEGTIGREAQRKAGHVSAPIAALFLAALRARIVLYDPFALRMRSIFSSACSFGIDRYGRSRAIVSEDPKFSALRLRVAFGVWSCVILAVHEYIVHSRNCIYSAPIFSLSSQLTLPWTQAAKLNASFGWSMRPGNAMGP